MKFVYCFCAVLMIGLSSAAPIAEPNTVDKVSEPKDSLMTGSTSIEIKEGKPIVTLEQRSDVIIPNDSSVEAKKVEIVPPVENVPKVSDASAIIPIVPVLASNIVADPVQVDKIAETSVDSSMKVEVAMPEKPVEQPSSVIAEEIVPKVEKVESVPVQPIVPEIVKPAEPVEETKSVPVQEPVSVENQPKVESAPVEIVSEKIAQPVPEKVIESRSLKEIDVPSPVESVQPVIAEKVESVPIPVESVPVVSSIESQPIVADKVETVPSPVEKSVEVQPSVEADKMESPVTITSERSIESQPAASDMVESPVSEKIESSVPVEKSIESQPVISEKVENPIPVSSVQNEISVESQPIPVPSVPVETPVESQPIRPENVENSMPVASISAETPVESQPVIAEKASDVPVQNVPTIVVSESQPNISPPIVEPVITDVKPIPEIPLIQETPIVVEPKPVVIIPQEPSVAPIVVPEQSENTIVAKPMEIAEVIAPEPMIESIKPQMTSVDIATTNNQPIISAEPNQI
uniref:Probable serine/threonine-protein kinase kinX n=1 Tax=Dermatophagoides pteronyssinus TaxID=6956 RepID=A0A6P6XY45_DERPT|nr:probable serine/threonine-protein kinase kinX [Dermatophagoides pteronyssinus]